MKQQLPQSFIRAGVTRTQIAAAAATNKVEARINMSADVAGAGLCPECRKPMERSNANGFPVMICEAHRIAIPMPDGTF
ncbi:TPA: hypothetical protein ACP7Q5_004995 [Escherichia coli]|jgi:hypothetical protein|uniref:TFIIB Transcription factor zinc-finger n=2 Tax=root TaxID=1 RepID=A0A8S5UIM0_9CAUD|nr:MULTISPECIES: hypothetical protein [Enterococcus]ELG7156164.1 hypothetical protein [Staphylococcus aureus]DAF94135.1 MAG TPA: TFIIB Transcription factor zinc-finger [Myoviridae sp. ctu2j3]HDW3906676.1 hypothetical protein [Escherichia coli]HEH8886024.1 hypothetical protein [Salmonella enterica]ELL1201049.1 hypothetical protein [Staphylococcus aureus]